MSAILWGWPQRFLNTMSVLICWKWVCLWREVDFKGNEGSQMASIFRLTFSPHAHTHRYSVRCVTGERISAGPLHSNACVLPRRSPLSGWSNSSQDVPVKDVDYLSFFFTTLTGAHTLAYTHRSYIAFNYTSTDSMLDIDKAAFPWSCASGFSSEMLRALQDTDEDGLLPSSTLSPLSVFATTLEQFLHHWDVVEVILSLSLLSDSPWQSPACVLCQLFCCQSLFLILLSCTLSPVSAPLLSHLVWLVSVMRWFWCQPTRLSAVCWLHLHYTCLPGTAFSALNIFSVHCLIFYTQ